MDRTSFIVISGSQDFRLVRIFGQDALAQGHGTVHTKEKPDYEGFFAHPMSWDTVVGKFEALSEHHTDSALRGEIADAVSRLESIQARELADLLGRVKEAAWLREYPL